MSPNVCVIRSPARTRSRADPILEPVLLQVFHQRHAAHQFGGADAALDAVKAGAPQVGTPDSDDRVEVMAGGFDGLVDLKIGGIGRGLSFQHAAGDDVQKREHTHSRAIDDQPLE